MFSGIIEHVGKIIHIEPKGEMLRLTIKADWDLSDVQLGDSIAVNGVCLTVVHLDSCTKQCQFDVSQETLRCTVGLNYIDHFVNLEKALSVTARLGGHIVSGHVDGLGKVALFESIGESWHLAIEIPPTLARYVAIKGSITINGVSLTINQLEDDFTRQIHLGHLNLIPHTLANTTLQSLKVGDAVNLEIDLVARYLERMQFFDKNTLHTA